MIEYASRALKNTKDATGKRKIMKNGEYHIRAKINQAGYDGHVIVACDIAPQKMGLTFEYHGSPEWQYSVQCAVQDFFEIYSKKSNNYALGVKVLKAQGHDFDSSHFLMIYVTMMALSNALDFKIDYMEINERGYIVLPHRNSGTFSSISDSERT